MSLSAMRSVDELAPDTIYAAVSRTELYHAFPVGKWSKRSVDSTDSITALTAFGSDFYSDSSPCHSVLL